MANKTKKTAKTNRLVATQQTRTDTEEFFLLKDYLQTLSSVYGANINSSLLEIAIASTIRRLESVVDRMITPRGKEIVSEAISVGTTKVAQPSLGFKKDGTPKKKPGPKKGQVTAVSASVPVTVAPTPFNVPAPPPPRIS